MSRLKPWQYVDDTVSRSSPQFKDWPYPADYADSIPHWQLADYIHRYWEHFGLPSITRLRTKVEQATKTDGQWQLRLRHVAEKGDALEETFYTEVSRVKIWLATRTHAQTFDAILVATGHYNAPRIPNLPGASDWIQRWPHAILHSKGYRRPETYAGQSVLIIGAGTSGMDIARDLSPHASRILVSSRLDRNAPTGYQKFRDTQRSRRPPGSEDIPEVKLFRSPQQTPGESEIELVDGTTVHADAVIFCTGYQYSFPFLPQYHADSDRFTPDLQPLILRGDHVLHLYRDVFYIPDPTLAFIGISVNTSAFSFFEYQAISVARVFAGTARLPAQPQQRQALDAVVGKKGPGKFRHFLGQQGEREYVRDTVTWLNRDAAWSGAPLVEGHTEAWLRESDQIAVKIAAKYGAEASSLGDLSGNADPPVVNNIEEKERSIVPFPISVTA